ncbi:MAG: hypothetical protein WCO96_05935 [Actinomycetes bacterium]
MAGHRSAGLARAAHVVPVDRRLSGPIEVDSGGSLAKVLPFDQSRARRAARDRGPGPNRRGVPAPVRPPLSRVRDTGGVVARPDGESFGRGLPDRPEQSVEREPVSIARVAPARPVLQLPRDSREAGILVSNAVAYLTEEIDPRHRREAERVWSTSAFERPRIDSLVGRLPEPLAPARWAFIGALGLIAAALASGQA